MRMEFCFPKELEDAKERRVPLCIPVGVLEYHANHCSLGCDVLIPSRLLERYEKDHEILIAPPVWYGPSSYAVAGPEKNSIHIDSDIFYRYAYEMLKALLKAGWRNIYVIIIHQSEAMNPTEAAFTFASRRALFEFLEETRGTGWWGRPENEDFERTLTASDNPWNWITVMPLMRREKGHVMPLDHAGYNEASLLAASCPEAVRLDAVSQNNDWFCASAANASVEHGEDMIKDIMKYWEEMIV